MDGTENALPINVDAIKKCAIEPRGASPPGRIHACLTGQITISNQARGRSFKGHLTSLPCDFFPIMQQLTSTTPERDLNLARALACSPHTSNAEGRATTESDNKMVARTKSGASHDLWLHPLIEHATKEGQAVSTPFWPTGSQHKNARTEAWATIHDLAIGGQHSDMGARTMGEKQGPRKAQRGNWKKVYYLSRRTLEHPQTPFLAGPRGGPIHEQINSARRQAYKYPRTIRTIERVSDYLSECNLVSRVDSEWTPTRERDPFQTRSSAQRSLSGKLTSEFHTTHSL
ncbi:hypothetical protein CRG98_021451 [Punica granatum]|uniref:Uncharacterized protein n=1 Tax=Punica granatum TaxID=22663 RepID=A0A2I0JQH8_PUNGR|nr:hypothetical protein CRG98_021451 [Punica granatum]